MRGARRGLMCLRCHTLVSGLYISFSLKALGDDFCGERRQQRWRFQEAAWPSELTLNCFLKQRDVSSFPVSQPSRLPCNYNYCSTDFLFHWMVSQGWTCLRAGLPEAVLDSAPTRALGFSQHSKPLLTDELSASQTQPHKSADAITIGLFPYPRGQSPSPHPSSGAPHSMVFCSWFPGRGRMGSFCCSLYFFGHLDFLGAICYFYLIPRFQPNWNNK